MISIREGLARIASFFRESDRHRELEAELAAHLALAADDNRRQGMTPEEAHRRARISLGPMGTIHDLHRESRGLPRLDSTLQDLRYGLRMLRRDAGLACFAILIIGVGVGASATVFSVVHAVLLRPLPFEEPDRLVWIANSVGPGLSGQTIQVSHLQDLRAESRAVSDIAGYVPFYSAGNSRVTGAGEPERLTGVSVTESFFPLLGVLPRIGRLFTAEECRANGPGAVLLGHRSWKRLFASDPGVVGRQLTVGDRPVTVVGVLPRSFEFDSLFAPGVQVDLYRPFPLNEETDRMGNMLALVGRLSAGAGLETAQAELTGLAARLRRERPERNDLRPRVSALRERVSGSFRQSAALLSGAVALVMLIVCANLSNLLLARSAARQREAAIRTALGATRSRLVQQMLTESLLLSTAGGAVGLLLAVLGTRMLACWDTARVPLLENVGVDGRVLAFTLSLAVSTGVVFGVLPAMRTSAVALNIALQENGRGCSQGEGSSWLRRALVVGEFALACTLLVGAGLLMRSLGRILDADLGFEPQSAATLRIDPGAQYSTQAQRNAYFDEALRRLRSAPGVTAAGLTDALPFTSNRSWSVSARPGVEDPRQLPLAFVHVVSEGYLRAMGIPLRSGRDLSAADDPSHPRAVVVNEALARTLWPNEDPLGKVLEADGGWQVVGVVRDVRHLAPELTPGAEIYVSIRQTELYSAVNVVVRGAVPAATLASGIRQALWPMDPNLPVRGARAIQELVDESVSSRRLTVLLLGGFAGFALILAALGVYGVISYSVAQRREEIAIRMTLGASPREVQRLIVGQTLKLVAVGLTIGIAASWSLAGALRGMLFGIRPSDPGAFGGALLLLIAVAALAGYLPALRASRVDPLTVLRTG
jgi:predicted permease